MTLSELLSKIEYEECINFFDYEISDVTESSSNAKEGCIFVCHNGAKYDAKNFIPLAKKSGSRVFVLNEIVDVEKEETLIISKNPRKTTAEISKILYGDCLSKMKIIGVTGTRGKTTVSKILSECIFSLGVEVVVISTLGIEFLKEKYEKIETDNTTPTSDIIYKNLKKAYECGIKVAVIEVSSQALANYRVHLIPFTLCVFTNFSKDHIGEFEHKNFEEYFLAKKSLFSNYGAKYSVVNSDDEKAKNISSGVERVITVGEENSDYRISMVCSSLNSSSFCINGEEFSLSLGASFNAHNAALAIVSASVLFAKDICCFKSTVKNVKIDGRFEVYRIGNKNIVIDFAHNEESFLSVIKNAKKFTRGRIILLFGSVGERSKERRKEFAKAAQKNADFSVITSDNPGFESSFAICDEIYSYFTDKSRAKVLSNREDAIKFAINCAEDFDTVLLLGKGHERYQIIEDKKVPFSEKDIILSIGAVKIE